MSSGPITPIDLVDVLRPFSEANGGAAQERDMAALVRRELVFLLDGRLTLTDGGWALHTEASETVEASGRELTAGIGVDEYAMAVWVLEP